MKTICKTPLRFVALCMALTLFLIPTVGCAAPEAERAVERIVITRESSLLSPGQVSKTLIGAEEVASLLALLEALTYRPQQNPYDNAEADTILTADRITLYSGETVKAEYFLRGGLYIREGDGAWQILADESWQQMWELLHRHAPFTEEQPPYGLSLDDALKVTSARIFRGQTYTQLSDPEQAEAFRSFMHNLQFIFPTDALDAAPFHDGGSLTQIQFLTGAAVVEQYYIYGQFVSPTPAGPSSILTKESYTALQSFWDPLV